MPFSFAYKPESELKGNKRTVSYKDLRRLQLALTMGVLYPLPLLYEIRLKILLGSYKSHRSLSSVSLSLKRAYYILI